MGSRKQAEDEDFDDAIAPEPPSVNNRIPNIDVVAEEHEGKSKEKKAEDVFNIDDDAFDAKNESTKKKKTKAAVSPSGDSSGGGGGGNAHHPPTFRTTRRNYDDEEDDSVTVTTIISTSDIPGAYNIGGNMNTNTSNDDNETIVYSMGNNDNNNDTMMEDGREEAAGGIPTITETAEGRGGARRKDEENLLVAELAPETVQGIAVVAQQTESNDDESPSPRMLSKWKNYALIGLLIIVIVMVVIVAVSVVNGGDGSNNSNPATTTTAITSSPPSLSNVGSPTIPSPPSPQSPSVVMPSPTMTPTNVPISPVLPDTTPEPTTPPPPPTSNPIFENSCHIVNPDRLGCDNTECQDFICGFAWACCDEGWTDRCVDSAILYVGICPYTDEYDDFTCFQYPQPAGCFDPPGCSAEICLENHLCCDVVHEGSCAQLAAEKCRP